MSKQLFYILFSITFLLNSCTIFDTTKKGNTKSTPTVATTQPTEPKKVVPSWLPQDARTYQPSRTIKNDLIHSKLEVSFDWEKQYLFGLATLTLKPYFFPQNKLELDARGMEIKI